jgi:hypothetical protein
MSNTFAILARFLEKYADEAEGHALDAMPPEVRQQLQAFAAGRMPPPERAQLSQLLKENPQWVELLAQAARQRSAPPGAATQS